MGDIIDNAHPLTQEEIDHCKDILRGGDDGSWSHVWIARLIATIERGIAEPPQFMTTTSIHRGDCPGPETMPPGKGFVYNTTV